MHGPIPTTSKCESSKSLACRLYSISLTTNSQTIRPSNNMYVQPASSTERQETRTLKPRFNHNTTITFNIHHPNNSTPSCSSLTTPQPTFQLHTHHNRNRHATQLNPTSSVTTFPVIRLTKGETEVPKSSSPDKESLFKLHSNRAGAADT